MSTLKEHCDDCIKELGSDYTYVHEWLDEEILTHYSFIKSDEDIFNNINITLLFGCRKCIDNYKLYIKHINKTETIYYGYNMYNIESRKNEYINLSKSDKNELLISIIGTICHRKNQQAFINDVYYRIKDKFNNVKLLLVGKEYNKLYIKEHYKESIIIVGEVDNPIPYINISDIIVSYSLNEVLPLNIIESMYCCKPIVSSDVGGISEILYDGINGYLIKPNEKELCYLHLINLIENVAIRDKFKLEAKNTFINMFDENKTFEPLLEIIKK